MIVFQNVSKLYNGAAALDNISFSIKPNEFVSVVGKNGAGKSTVVKLLIGEERPTKGRVFFDDLEVNRLRHYEMPLLRREIGVVFQDCRLLPTKTVYENVAFALEIEGKPQSDIDETVPWVLDMVGLKKHAHNFPDELSGGEKQRTAIARAFIRKPKLLIADEPTGNLDPINTMEIIKLMLKINKQDTAVMLVSHNKEVINDLHHRVITLDDGKIVRDEEKGKYMLV